MMNAVRRLFGSRNNQEQQDLELQNLIDQNQLPQNQNLPIQNYNNNSRHTNESDTTLSNFSDGLADGNISSITVLEKTYYKKLNWIKAIGYTVLATVGTYLLSRSSQLQETLQGQDNNANFKSVEFKRTNHESMMKDFYKVCPNGLTVRIDVKPYHESVGHDRINYNAIGNFTITSLTAIEQTTEEFLNNKISLHFRGSYTFSNEPTKAEQNSVYPDKGNKCDILISSRYDTVCIKGKKNNQDLTIKIEASSQAKKGCTYTNF